MFFYTIVKCQGFFVVAVFFLLIYEYAKPLRKNLMYGDKEESSKGTINAIFNNFLGILQLPAGELNESYFI